MRWGLIGGWLLIGGTLVSLAASAPLWSADPPVVGPTDAFSLLVNASLALIGVGAGILSAFGPSPLNGRGVRIALGVWAIGTLSFLILQLIPFNPTADSTTQLLHSAASAVGNLGSLLGMVLLGVALVRAGGPSRLVGALLLAGLALLPVGFLLGGVTVLRLAAIPTTLGYIGVGVLAVRGERATIATEP